MATPRITIPSQALEELQTQIIEEFKPSLVQHCILGTPQESLVAATSDKGYAVIRSEFATTQQGGMGVGQWRALLSVDVIFLYLFTPETIELAEKSVVDSMWTFGVWARSKDNILEQAPKVNTRTSGTREFPLTPTFGYETIGNKRFRTCTFPIFLDLRHGG